MQQETDILDPPSTVSNNIVRNNVSTGIYAFAAVLVSGNTVYGQSASGAVGISSGFGYGGASSNNVLYTNYVGIETDYTGIRFATIACTTTVTPPSRHEGSLPVPRQRRLFQQHRHPARRYDFNGIVDDNLVYANTTDGILVENSSSGGGLIVNNTVYQVSGNAVRMDSSSFNVKLRNNILWVQAGYDIYVADNSRRGSTATTTIFTPAAAPAPTSVSGTAPSTTARKTN